MQLFHDRSDASGGTPRGTTATSIASTEAAGFPFRYDCLFARKLLLLNCSLHMLTDDFEVRVELVKPRIDFRDELLVLSVFSFLFGHGPALFYLIHEFSFQGCKEVICDVIFIPFFVYFLLEKVHSFDIIVIETIVVALVFEGWTKPRLSNDKPRLLTFTFSLSICFRGILVLLNSSLGCLSFMHLAQLLVQVQELLFI